MNERIRHKALSSAARVALGCFLGAAGVGCGGKVHSALESDGSDPSEAAAAERAPAEPVLESAPEPEFPCTGTAAQDSAPNEQSPAVQCCRDYVAEAVGVPPFAEVLSEEPSIRNCCRELALHAHFEDEPSHRFCCSSGALSQEDFRRSYCSPWGPPVPPALGQA